METESPLSWDRGLFAITPVWRTTPCLTSIAEVARQQLDGHPTKIHSLDATYFASGAFNRLYLLHADGEELPYLMRVTLPVYPFFKTASEVATLSYLGRYTSIPVPRAIAYSTSADNRIGFEWMLLERMPGDSLGKHLESMSFDTKLHTTESIASLLNDLSLHRFPAIGSLYLSKDLKDYEKNLICPIPDAEGFCIGPVVDPEYYIENRTSMQMDRGPFDTEQSWVASMINACEVAVTSAPLTHDDDEIEDKEAQITLLHELRELSCRLFKSPSATHEGWALHHPDMSASNLLIVSQKTWKLSAWVDWENVRTAPKWASGGEPTVLGDILETCVPETRIDDNGKASNNDPRMSLQHRFRHMRGGEQDELDIWRRGFLQALAEVELDWFGASKWVRRCNTAVDQKLGGHSL